MSEYPTHSPRNAEAKHLPADGGSASSAPTAAPGPARPKAPGYYRFAVGDIIITVVSDGRIFSGDPRKSYDGDSPDRVAAVLQDSFLDTDRVVLEENAVVADFGNRRVLFDCGVGRSTLFGSSGGRLLANLTAAGIAPGSIDAILLSHAHPDHVGGLMGEDEERNFPNAQLYMSKAEFDFWTSSGRTGPSLTPLHLFAREQLWPNRDRLHFIQDGQEVLPGTQAVSSPGHTIGHTHFLLASASQMLAYTADLSRHHVLGLEQRWAFSGDHDPAQSLTTRDRFMASYAEERTPILSYHYPWPGLGHVTRWNGAYRYVPTSMDVS